MPTNVTLPLSRHLEKNKNSFGLLRIVAASAVVFSHSWPATKGSWYPEPLQIETGYTLGWHAVNLFFMLSGLLIAGSLDKKRSIGAFFINRFLRIYPALLVVILSTVFLSALLVDHSTWDGLSAFEYVARNFLLVGSSATLPGVFANNPEQYRINVPLWTLKYEVFAYFTIAMLSALSWKHPRVFSLKLLTLLILISGSIVMVSFGTMEGQGFMHHVVRLTFSFYLGVACWIWRNSLRIDIWCVTGLAMLNGVFLWSGFYYLPAQIVFLSALALWIGTRKFGAISGFTDKQDYSYGVYIMGYPIQQAVMALTDVPNPWYNFALTMTLVVPIAAVSWNLVEQPSLRFKKNIPKETR